MPKKRDSTNGMSYRGSSIPDSILEEMDNISNTMGISFAKVLREVVVKWYLKYNPKKAKQNKIVVTTYIDEFKKRKRKGK